MSSGAPVAENATWPNGSKRGPSHLIGHAADGDELRRNLNTGRRYKVPVPKAKLAQIAEAKKAGKSLRSDLQYMTVVGETGRSHYGMGVSEFETEVSEQLKMGWELKGGVSIDGGRAAQALTRSADFVPPGVSSGDSLSQLRASMSRLHGGPAATVGGAGAKAPARKRSRRANRNRGTRRRNY
jgi:hypothetical protein